MTTSIPDIAPTMKLGELNKLAKLLATEDIHIEHKNVPSASFDTVGRVLTLPVYKGMTRNMYHLLVLHEVGHALFTDPEQWIEAVSGKPAKVKTLINILEDARIEKLIKNKYPGAKRDMREGYKEFHAEDFFKIKGRNLNNMVLADRINLHYKLGEIVTIPFSKVERQFLNAIDAAKNFDDILKCCSDISAYMSLNEPDSIPIETQIKDLSNSANGSGSAFPEENETQQVQQETADKPKQKTEEQPTENSEADSSETSSDKQDTPEEKDNDSKGASLGVDDVEDAPEELGGTGEATSQTSPIDADTYESLNKALESMLDREATPNVYLDMDLCTDWKQFIISYQMVLASCAAQLIEAANTYSEQKPIDPLLYNNTRKKAAPIVDYLVREFEMEKAADRYVHSRQAKTGKIDPKKLHTYKFSEDIFNKIDVSPDAKNHGLVIVVDFSLSMDRVLKKTMEQLIGLVMFCRKTTIPHRVYAFSQPSQSYEAVGSKFNNTGNDTIVPPSNMRMIELFSEKMSLTEYRRMVEYLIHFSMTYYNKPRYLRLGITPLDGSAMLVRHILRNLKEETQAQILSCIFLTDGDSTPTFLASGSHLPYGVNTVVNDKKRHKSYVMNDFNNDMTSIVMQAIRDDGVHLVNFRISGLSDARSEISRAAYRTNPKTSIQVAEKLNKQFKAVGCCAIPNYRGFDNYYIIRNENLHMDEEFHFHVKPEATRTQIQKAFIVARDLRTNQRAILTSFAKQISKAVTE